MQQSYGRRPIVRNRETGRARPTSYGRNRQAAAAQLLRGSRYRKPPSQVTQAHSLQKWRSRRFGPARGSMTASAARKMMLGRSL